MGYWNENLENCSECGIYAEDGDFTEWCWEDACEENRAGWLADIAAYFITGVKPFRFLAWGIPEGVEKRMPVR